MPPLESLESSPEPSSLELSSPGLVTVEASSCVSCWTRMSSKPSASWYAFLAAVLPLRMSAGSFAASTGGRFDEVSDGS